MMMEMVNSHQIWSSLFDHQGQYPQNPTRRLSDSKCSTNKNQKPGKSSSTINHQNYHHPRIFKFEMHSNILFLLLLLSSNLFLFNSSSSGSTITTTKTKLSIDNNYQKNYHRNEWKSRKMNAEQQFYVEPLLRIHTRPNSEQTSSQSSSLQIELPFVTSLLPSLIPKNKSSSSISLHLTAKTLDHKKYPPSTNESSNELNWIKFWSSNFVYSEQHLVDNDDFHETIETRHTNHSEYYSNHLIDELMFSFKKHSNQSSSNEYSNSNHHKRCQLFDGFIIILEKNFNNFNNNKNSNSASITICNDGTMNGFVTMVPFGHLILENAQTNQHCQINRIEEKSNDNVMLLKTCPHAYKFVRSPTIQMKNLEENRRKRSYSSERTIEILVVTDKSMYDFHGNSLRNYVFTLMAMVSHLFKHSSIGNEINIKLVKWTSLVDEKQEKNWFGSAHKTLRHFCRWQYEHNYQSDNDPLHHDTAILLTKFDLCSKNENSYNEIDGYHPSKTRISCDTLGLAHSGQICDPESSCAIVEDNGLSAAFTIAHELGHLLGVPHDDEEQCKKYYAQMETPKRQEFNVMVRMIDSTSHMWSWSSCSKHFITEFLDSGHGDCLLDNNSVDVRQSSEVRIHPYDTYQRRSFYATKNWVDKLAKVPAGALYSADEQCRLVFDKNSSICLDMPYCRKLWCTSNNVGGCRTHHLPWADGTECGNGYWCQEGECVRIDGSSRRPVDGGWGEWSSWSECSLNCGGGIRRSRRECNNPSPKYGGKFCIGERVKYESCNLEPCSYQSPNDDARAKQCSEFDQYNMTWLPKYTGIPNSDLCALYCESNTGESHKLKSRVVDGTPCSPDSYDICVNGKCLSAGCDRILGSNVHTDYCGVCGGDNSTCREISGQFKPRFVSHGYTFVLSIPPGATNVEITKEHSIQSDNWLALRGEYGNYLLNGHFTVNVYERKWYYGRTTVEYSGTKRHEPNERINISRPIQNPLHLEVLCVGELHVPVINFRYAVTANNPYLNYKWISDPEWSQCSKDCNGEQERKPYCVAIIHPSWLMENSQPMISEIKVKDEYCGIHTRPATEYRVCNAHCELEWHFSQIGACSTKCGHGFRTRQVNCTQTFINHSERIYIDDFYCSHLGPKPSDRENCTGNECRVTYQWQYSEWSPCALHQTCGTGQQTRTAHCLSTTFMDSNPHNALHSNVGQELCTQHLSEPVLVQACQVECPRWKTNPWSECSGTCEQSVRTRTVTCMHGDQHVIDAYCETLQAKPMERMPCEMPNCQTIDPMNNFYHVELQNKTKVHNQDVSFFHAEESMINNEIVVHNNNHHYLGTWQSGEWSSCDTLYNMVRIFKDKFIINFHVPECFDTNEQINSFRERFIHLFKLNESLHSNSYSDLASLINLDESNLIRGRYVACVLPNSQHVLSDSECDYKLRPKSEEKCPISEKILTLIPKFNAKLCSSKLAKSMDSISYEIEPKLNAFEDNFDPYKIKEEIKWKSNDWSNCECDFERKIFIRKRTVVCVRVADENTISDEYCLHEHLSKPNDMEECKYLNDDYYHNQLECNPYGRAQKQTYQTDYSSTQNLTANEQMLNGNKYQQSALLPSHSHYSFLASDQLITLTPSLSSISTTSEPTMSSESLANMASDTILPTVSLQSTFDSTDSTRLPSFNFHLSTSHEPISNEHIDPQMMSSSTEKPLINMTLYSSTISPYQILQPLNGGWSEWTEWTECSVSCGNGVQSREARCTLRHCEERLKPQPQYRSCYRMCGFFQWHYSEWSPCSANCGTGFRTRNAECRDWTGFPVPNRFCENESPITKERCRMNDCKLVWRSGQWSECSQPCGQGVQTRTVTCHRINKFGVVDPQPLDYSNSILKRRRKHFKLKRKTKRKKYINKVARRRNRQSIHSTNWCNMETKPSQTQICNLGNCLQPHQSDAYVWRTTDWQMCSTPCGFGYQRRKVYCYSQKTNNRVDRSRCDPKFRPEKRRQCNLRSCEVISCQDRRDRTRVRNDGEYELWVQGAMIRVYCFGMDYLEKPREYLILNENTIDDNYSELDVGSGDCSRYSRLQPGMKKLYFKYVRFDALTMEIYANDTRFSVAQDSNSNTLPHSRLSIGYGQAFFQGCPLSAHTDHSNNVNCYFGSSLNQTTFSINLQKTGLVIDEDQWIMSVNDYSFLNKNIQISRNGEKIIGHCRLYQDKLPITMPSSNDCLIGCQPIDNIIKVRIP